MTPCRRRAIYASRNEPLNVPLKVIEDTIIMVAPILVNAKACTKCGKVCERGLHIHMKYCKG